SFPPLTARINYHTSTAPHQVTIEPEGRTPGRLQIRWQPAGITANLIHPLARRAARPKLRRAARLLRSALR
ncbi:glycosyltransferase family 2 protein, partial [Streptomyces muensis]|nr:glycosyltransferase family 2 protein [Streptomyces muensis]